MGAASFKHLRHSTGLAQPAFARLIGFSPDTVASVEQGRAEVSERLANAAFIATGAIPVFLSMPDSLAPEAQAWTRETYAPHHFHAWQRMTRGDLLASVNGGAGNDRFVGVIQAFLDAAKDRNRLGQVQAAIALALHQIAFDGEFADTARTIAHEAGRGTDFDFLALVSGRINP